MPTACAATPIRPPSKVCLATRNPCPSSQSRFSTGTMQFSRESSVVSDPRIPIFSMVFPMPSPGLPRSTRNAVMPRCFDSWLVRARSTKRSACLPFVTKVLVPLST
jgi:hypothetical protein